MVLGTETTHRRFASIERVGFFEIARTINARTMRRESSSSEESPSSTAELSICGNQAGTDYRIRPLISIERFMGSRHAFIPFPLFQNFLFVEDQGIAIAVQHGLGTLFGSLSH
jgi:hypothetical protein